MKRIKLAFIWQMLKKEVKIVFFAAIWILTCSGSVIGQDYYQRIQSPDDIASTNFQGIKYLFEQSDDTLHVINFWATWCKPCIEELPYFEELAENYVDKPVKITLVSLDFPKQIASKLFPFIQKHKIKSTVIHLNDPDANSWIDQVNESWSGSLPATYIYQGDRREFFEQSFESFAEINAIIKNINHKI